MAALTQPTEVQILILALALTPVMVWAYRDVDFPGRHWLLGGIVAIMASYVATILEGFVAHELLDSVEHLAIAVSGACFLGLSINLLRWYRSTDADRSEP